MAPVAALHAGRIVALVQRKKCRMHLASIGAGDASWAAFCDRDVLADGATIANPAIGDVVEQYGPELCAHCYRMMALAAYLTTIRPEILDTRKQATR